MPDNEPIRFRDYQIDVIANIFQLFGIEPAGPKDDPIVARCRSNRDGQDDSDGRSNSPLAGGSSDDAEPSVRTE